MSNHYQTAQLIPSRFRKQLLNDNIIYKAVVAPNDMQMSILVILYKNYIFTEGEDIDMNNPCLKCLDKILTIFKLILPELIQLEKEENLLNSV